MTNHSKISYAFPPAYSLRISVLRYFLGEVGGLDDLGSGPINLDVTLNRTTNSYDPHNLDAS
jgi:hypothetical protein